MGHADSTSELAAVRAAVRAAADACCALFASAPDGAAPVPGSQWNVSEVAVHLARGIEMYTEWARGGTEPFVDLSDIAGGSLARSSAARLAAEPERNLAALTGQLRAASVELLAATEGRTGAEPVMWNGRQIRLDQLLGIGLGEFVLHGRDVARAIGRPWPIRPDDARLVLAAALPLLPLLVDPRTTANVDATFELRVRGGARTVLVVRRGTLTIGDDAEPVDCRVSADPVALLLVAYGRRSQWPAVFTGKLVAAGRKPWLGLRLTRYLVTP